MDRIDFLLSLFKLEGKSAEKVLTPTQKKIFEELITRKNKRVHIQTATQYGKSLVVALACLVISAIQDEVVAVVAPTTEKAKIIMRYYIEHLGDNILFYSQLEAGTKLERLKKEGSKERIILKDSGGIYVLSTNERSILKSFESAMGHGSPVVILDEACLISDQSETSIYRMLAGKGKKAFYCKIGNPFYRTEPYSHFYKSSNDSRYKQYLVDYKLGLKEGRYTEEFIEEAREKPLFDVYYECKFPDEEEIDERGYRRLLTIEEIKGAMIKKLPKFMSGNFILGCDIARGGNFNAYVGRDNKTMWLHGKNRSSDLMTNVVEIKKAKADITAIDDVGVGGGVVDRCRERGIYIIPVIEGGTAEKKEVFKNIRSELFFKFREWIKAGGHLEESDHWLLLYEIKWKMDSGGRFMLEPKEELKKRAKLMLTRLGSESPDIIDAGSLTFIHDKKPKVEFIESEEEKPKRGILKKIADNEKDVGV